MSLRALALVAASLVLASCTNGAPEVSEDGKVVALDALVELGAGAGVGIESEDAVCVFERLGQSEADTLASGGSLDDAALLVAAEAIVDCVGSHAIAGVLLSAQAPTATEAELECATDQVDDELVVRLVLSALESEPVSRPAVELAVASSLALCLSPENLLNQG